MKRSKTMRAFTIFLIAVSLSSCTLIPAVKFPDISTAYSITIINNWSGLSPAAPINALYILETPSDHFANEQFQGSAQFSVGGYFGDTTEETTQISVPNDVMQAFLQKLSQVSPKHGEYEPLIEWTDDYPEITIRVLYGNAENIEFYTASQGEEHIPWKVTYDGTAYVVNSGLPMHALELLSEYLAQDVQTNLIEQVKKQAQ